VDARPRWSRDGRRIAFVRDSGIDTSIVVIDTTGRELGVIDSPAIELDPEFSADGKYLFYSSARGDELSLWRRHLDSGVDEQLTDLRQVERNARRLADGQSVLYLHGAGAHRVLRRRDFTAGTDEVVHAETLTYHLTADAHPTRRLITYSAPIDNDYHLWTLDLDDPRVKHRLTHGERYITNPAFSADGNAIYFNEIDERRQLGLWRIETHGGRAEPVGINRWEYTREAGSLRVRLSDSEGNTTSARVSIVAKSGHPVASPEDATYFDSRNGRHYFYVDSSVELTLPAGEYRINVSRGPMQAPLVQTVRVVAGRSRDADFRLAPLWDAGEAGYVSADHHGHLNADGHHRAKQEHALRLLRGEDLTLVSPLSWNRWERRVDEPLVGRSTSDGEHYVAQGQEVRSHFHGHIGLLGAQQPFAPWFFGPRNPVLGNPDLSNGDVIAFADQHEAFPTYVHPVGEDDDPFAAETVTGIPLELITDAVLGERMGLELVCAWTSPLGTAELWYRLLNLGKPVAAMSGTDAYVDFHRTPALGTGRNYLRIDGEVSPASVLAAASAGRGFVTTAPALLFRVGDGARPGDVVSPGARDWSLELHSTVAVDRVELIVNGSVVRELEGVGAGEAQSYSGSIDLPEGGWIAARAYSSERPTDSWPSMHVRPFAHSSPIWIGAIGSVQKNAQSSAAADLLRGLDAAEERARDAYGERPMPRMYTRFASAREKLRVLAGDSAAVSR
jgi:TolB protein